MTVQSAVELRPATIAGTSGQCADHVLILIEERRTGRSSFRTTLIVFEIEVIVSPSGAAGGDPCIQSRSLL